uniref:Reverse transcriptase domain-containing protein n=1 Tax=Tanacetum cinerariifolium TaxID=118510 RepID=A0A6L2M637_TANCI|nr:reverse transcriptase domain-containing protein [Tanacetum cinerariifolium]
MEILPESTSNSSAIDRDDRYPDDPIHSMGLKIEIPEFTGKSKVETWEKMKKLTKAKFRPENHTQEAFLDYHNLSQQNMTMEEVINEFDKLRMRCDVVKEEEQVVVRFLGVLKPEIADIVKIFTSRFTPPTMIAPLTTPKTAPEATTPTTSAAGNTLERVDNARHCYKCGGLGHFACDCLNLKKLAFVPDDADLNYDTDAKPEVDEPGDELVYPDLGEALVSQRVLNVVVSKSVDDNSWLRNNIFRTKCTYKGNFCDMIIDGGSCKNVVSTYMVKKLGMKIEDHHEPYQLTWLKKGILLKKTKHDGFQNTYNFKKDGVNITLVPFDSRQTRAEGSNLFIKNTGFEELMKTSPYVFTLVVVEEYKIISESPLQLHGSTIFSKIDLRSGYHQIRMRPGDERKAAFKTHDGLYEWMVMPFGLSNAPSTFMRFMNQKLYANGKKCHFLVTEVTFLGYIVTGSGIKIDPTKVEAIISRPTPSTIRDIRSFHGLASVYRHFIRNFSFIIAHLTKCMKGGQFTWTTEAAMAFDILKAKMERDVNKLLERCRTCYIAKTHSSNAGLYTPLSVHVAPREEASFDFVLGLPRTQRAKDYVMVVVDRFSKIAYFVPCSKTFDASQVARLYFAEIVKMHGVPKNLTSNRDVKFFIGENAKQWDLILPQAEFAYNRSVNRTIGKSPFEIVYGWNLITPLDLVPVPKMGWFSEEGVDQSEQIKELHRSEVETAKRWSFSCSKKINDNAYKIKLPSHYKVFDTFNVPDLSPYKGDSDDEPDLWSSLFQEREDDADAVNEGVNVTNMLGAYFATINFCGGLG